MKPEKEQNYSQEEVFKNISIFNKKEEDLINERKELNKAIAQTRKQKEYWESLDLRQLKLL